MVSFVGDVIDLSVQSPRLARIWTVQRQDGTVKYVTDHDKNIVFGLITFTPVFGFQVTTRESQISGTTLEAQGLMDDTVFKYSDFVGGLYEEAVVTEYTLDWKYPWRPVIRTEVYWMGAVKFDEETWKVPLEGPSRFMKLVMGRRVTKLCPLELFKTGDGECNASSVGKIYTDVIVASSVDRTTFTIVALTPIPVGLPEDRFADGKLTWTQGTNAGVESVVKTSDAATGGDYTMVLYLPTPFDITPGDEFTLEWGCDRTIETCANDFNNMINHGGEAHTPGPDIGGNIERVKTS